MAKMSIKHGGNPDYVKNLMQRINDLNESEMGKIGRIVRKSEKDRTYGLGITNWALAGAVLGGIRTQYHILDNNGHSRSESQNESCEELTQTLNPFYQANGIPELFGVCSITARIGAMYHLPQYMKLLEPVFKNINMGSKINVNSMMSRHSTIDMERVGDVVRQMRPENYSRKSA